jgi:3,4-dihydroxy 2-butanone 4-phosphate synthase/GTP cyclohydrolase II
MIKNARGLVCVPIGAEQAKRLQLNPMVEHNTDAHGTSLSQSPSTISKTRPQAFQPPRGDNGKALANPLSRAEDFPPPGHIFPLVARHGGVLKRAGHTEAAVDLSRMAGFNEGGVICEIMNEDGSMGKASSAP